MEYSKHSKELTKSISKIEKKQFGIYFTPPKCIQQSIELLKKLKILRDKIDILEPSCGSGEFLYYLHQHNPTMNITGIEWNKTVFDSTSHMFSKDFNSITIHHLDYLTISNDTKYDLIIGNPPFNVIHKTEIDSKYLPMMDGRPNIFNIFILKSLELLKQNGVLCFVLPATFLNSSYYDKTRRHLYENYTILHIGDCEGKYLETTQPTILLIIQNNCKSTKRNNNKYTLTNIKNRTILNHPDTIRTLLSLIKSTTTLSDLGFQVKVGNVVWNQVKSALTDDSTKTRLVYSSDIRDKKVIISDFTGKEKENYVDKTQIIAKSKTKFPYTIPMILINRGYGKGSYTFNYAYIDGSYEYYVENHLLCVMPKEEIHKKELDAKFSMIMKSLDDERTSKFIQLFFANDAITTQELSGVLPIYT